VKALTVKNPWAYLICSGAKDIENRSWRTSFRGRVLIHAAAALDLRDFVPRVDCPAPCSAIIGSVEIVDCLRDSSSPWAFADFWHWVLRDPVLFERPILDIRGALSFWEIPEGVSIPTC
jgi:hypothetical protein